MKTFRTLITEVNWKPTASTTFPVSDKVEYTATSKDGKVVVCVHENSDGTYGVLKKYNNVAAGPAAVRVNIDSAKRLANALTAAYDLDMQPQKVSEAIILGLNGGGEPSDDAQSNHPDYSSPFDYRYATIPPKHAWKHHGILRVIDAPQQNRATLIFATHADALDYQHEIEHWWKDTHTVEVLGNKAFLTGLPIKPTTIGEGKLTTKQRNALPDTAFALPKDRKYPIHNKTHARDALSRVSAHGTPAEKRKVKAAVHAKYPKIEISEAYGETRRQSSTLEDMVADAFNVLGEKYDYAIDIADIMSHIKAEFGATPSITEVVRVLSSRNYTHNNDGTYSPGLIGEGTSTRTKRRI